MTNLWHQAKQSQTVHQLFQTSKAANINLEKLGESVERHRRANNNSSGIGMFRAKMHTG